MKVLRLTFVLICVLTIGACVLDKPPQQIALGNVTLSAPDLAIKLSSKSGKERLLRIKVQIVLETEADRQHFYSESNLVLESFRVYLRELQLKNLRGPQGWQQLKKDLLMRARGAAPDVKIRDVVLNEVTVH